MIKYVFFDLDGTLTNPKIGITNSIYYGLEKFGINPPSRNELEKYIGPELVPSFISDFGMTKDEAYKTLGYFREYFQDKGIFENEVYPDIENMLGKIKEAGLILAVASSKPEVYVKRILEHFDLIKYFDYVAGNNMEETRGNKKDILNYLMNEEIKIPDEDRELVVMVGDRQYDVIGAKEANTKSIGVLYGFGSFEELSNVDPDYLVNDVCELTNTILSL